MGLAALPLMVPAQDWRALDFLLGQWTGAGSGTPGSSTGSFSFNRDLQGKVLIRRSFAESVQLVLELIRQLN